MEFKHKPGDRVHLKELDLKARILSIIVEEGCHEYKVSYFMNGEQTQAYVKDDDLE